MASCRPLFQLLYRTALLCCAASAQTPASGHGAHYVGSDVCALCHKAIGATQAQTAMANTWHRGQASGLPASFKALAEEGPDPAVTSLIRRVGSNLLYSAKLPEHSEQTVTVEATIGGDRHGLGFLTRLADVQGAPLARPVLLQSRFAWSVRENKLVLAPGCPTAKPTTYQTALGLPLSPEYERRCLECHGEPRTPGAGEKGGVQCETCHGPGSGHLQAMGRGDTHSGILNPKHLSAEERIEICAKCHVGLTRVSDPAPEDLLVANQATALRASECFIQSRRSISCETCHNPHEDASASDVGAIRACLSCHSTSVAPHAAICPVNPKEDCVSCHMPAVDIGPFHLIDHQIRVHPEQATVVGEHSVRVASQYPPISEYLEQVQVKTSGERRVMYLGRKLLAEQPEPFAAAAVKLAYGESSAAFPVGKSTITLRRMPRDFKWQAARLASSAELHLANGNLAAALAQSQAALAIYPQSLRALVTIGRALSQGGNNLLAASFLQRASVLFPDDANSAYNLGRVFVKQGRTAEAIASLSRAVQSDPDFASAYLSLGQLLLEIGQVDLACKTFQSGLNTDPMNAPLYRALALALARRGDPEGSKRSLRTAVAIEAGTILQ